MFALARQALGQPSKLVCRRLATEAVAATPDSPLEGALLNRRSRRSSILQARSNVRASVRAANSPDGTVVEVEQAVPTRKPVYVAMSSLIPPPRGTEPVDQVAELDPTVFAHPIRRDILHLCVVHHLDSLRQGSANTKTRGEVRGSGRKIRRQKGSGRARLGDGQSPMLKGGGVAFGPKPRDFSTKLNRKVIQMGLRVALSTRVKERGLRVVESLEWKGNKTQGMLQRLKELKWDQDKVLFVSGEADVPERLERTTRNLHNVEVMSVEEATVYDLVKWSTVVLDAAAVQWYERTLGKEPFALADPVLPS